MKKKTFIWYETISGEEKSISPENLRPWLDWTLPKLLLLYESESIYNVDETALFYKLRPDKTLTFKGERGVAVQETERSSYSARWCHYGWREASTLNH